MALITRTAMIQARVFPPVKEASERVLSRIGLNMSEAMELFLRRIIVDERLPFEVVALDMTRLGVPEHASVTHYATANAQSASQTRQKRGSKTENISKTFSGDTAPRRSRTTKRTKKN
jgi:addiction module RelB/DinJ family antitoxin